VADHFGPSCDFKATQKIHCCQLNLSQSILALESVILRILRCPRDPAEILQMRKKKVQMFRCSEMTPLPFLLNSKCMLDLICGTSGTTNAFMGSQGVIQMLE